VSRMTRGFTLLALAAALAIAGCGGDDGSGGAYGGTGGETGETTTTQATPNPEEGATFVSLGSVPDLGLVLVDSKGYTLYEFHKDKGNESACYGNCARIWPPLLSEGEPHPGNGAQGSLLGTTQRRDGTTQVTYAGHPLYTYAADRKPGEASGNDFSSFGAEWYALNGNGEDAEK
jgi:predicted lipoprotein with Yx(FWY)xxD motif